VTGTERGILLLRASRAVFLVAAVLAVAMGTVLASVSLAAAFAMLIPVAALAALVVVETASIRALRQAQELERHAGRAALAQPALAAATAGMSSTADLTLGFARLSATLGSCSHPDAEPVDLSTGERVAWVCANPECNAELPAGWTPPATVPVPHEPAACKCPGETRDPVWVRVPESATPVASYCAPCGRGTGTLTSAGSVQPSGTAAPSGTGTLSAPAYAFTPGDIALMRSGANFGTDAPVTFPSGKKMTGTEIGRWIEQDKNRQWIEQDRWEGP
jgi:hypothetical protein